MGKGKKGGKASEGKEEKKGGRGGKRGREEREREGDTCHTNPSLLPVPLYMPSCIRFLCRLSSRSWRH